MYNWIETTFNVSGGVTQAIAVILALSVVLLLFGLFIFILKRLMGGQTSQNRNRQPRIAVMDTASVDTRRRLVLIRRDNIEHLLLVGGPSDVVVEQNIIRNTPLTQSRPGHPAPAGLAGSAPVRGPMAPGPDIPVRPDDLIAQNESVPSPAAQARTPAPSARPTPTMPAPAESTPPETSAPGQSAAATSRDRTEPPSPVINTPPAPPTASTDAPVKAADDGQAAGAGPVEQPQRSPNRAADLLRAATQNGFSRTPSKLPAAASEETPKQMESAPAVRPAAKPASPSQAPESGKPGSRLGSLARPFSPRDRPSYGTQSISPPASGPAARAKTALLKPLEGVQQQGKVEPVLAATPVKVTAEPVDVSVRAVSAEQDSAPTEKTPVAPAASLSSSSSGKTPVTGDNEGEQIPDNPSQERQDTGTEAPLLAVGEPGDVAAEPAPETLQEKAAETSAAPQIELDMSDLLEPASTATDAPADSGEPAKAKATSEDQVTQAPPETEAHGEVAEEPEAPEVKATPIAEDGASKKPVEPVRTAPRPTTGLGDKNPIEDEMAKILDELGGQPN
jgi:flagellar biogenesis protein FliO